MRVGVIGAGIAGLATTKVLSSVGHDVVTFDRLPDLGGVWSAARRYPGLRTQNTRHTYAFSDHSAPSSLPDHPTGAQWQGYLASYVDRFGFGDNLRLGLGVDGASPTPFGWSLALDDDTSLDVDHLVIANGVFSLPKVPDWRGADEHARAGGS